MMEIYYIKDDENIAMAVKEYLSQKGYAVSIFGTLESGKKALEHHIPGIVRETSSRRDGSTVYIITALYSIYRFFCL